jgi:hypothetical protein
MNGRHRSPRGIRSHESGNTTMKKIANVAVGKSTAMPQLRRRAAVEIASRTARRRSVIYPDAGGVKRVSVLSVASAISRAVRSTGGANHDGSWGGVAETGAKEP